MKIQRNERLVRLSFILFLLVGMTFSFSCKKDQGGSVVPLPGEDSSGQEVTPPDKDNDSSDSVPPYTLKLQNAKWDSTWVSDAILWKYFHFTNLFSSHESITVFDVDLNNKKVSVTIPHVTTGYFIKTSDAAASVKASAAINGSYFDTKNGGSTTFFRYQGDIISYTTLAKWRSNAGFSIDKNNNVSIVKEPTSNAWTLINTYNLLASGPLLVYNGKVLNLDDVSFNTGRNPRTAIGLTKDNKLIAVVVDGRASQSDGMSNTELAQVMKSLGCEEAMNLDGGGSSTAWVKSEGVVNYPSDNKKFDHGGERAVATVIAFVMNK